VFFQSKGAKRVKRVTAILFIGLGLLVLGQSGKKPPTTTLIVKMANGLAQSQRQAAIERHGGTLKASISKLDLHIIEVPTVAADAITKNLKKDSAFARIEANTIRRWQGSPSDTMVSNQWSLPKVAWDQVYGSITPQFLTTVAILDTGVDASHPDLFGAIAPGTSIIDSSNGLTDPNGHGTSPASSPPAQTTSKELPASAMTTFRSCQSRF
jgi:hypothetical protein